MVTMTAKQFNVQFILSLKATYILSYRTFWRRTIPLYLSIVNIKASQCFCWLLNLNKWCILKKLQWNALRETSRFPWFSTSDVALNIPLMDMKVFYLNYSGKYLTHKHHNSGNYTKLKKTKILICAHYWPPKRIWPPNFPGPNQFLY